MSGTAVRRAARRRIPTPENIAGKLGREGIWGAKAYLQDPRAADVQIQNIRREIEPDPKHPRYLLTVRGAGYRFAEL